MRGACAPMLTALIARTTTRTENLALRDAI
jgi:hypothetical protein